MSVTNTPHVDGLALKAYGLKMSLEAWIFKVLNWTIQ